MSWQNDEQLCEQLSAFADGELPAELRPAMLAVLAANPDAAAWLAEQQRLSQALRQELIAHAEAAPQALRAKIARLSVSPPRRQRPVSLNWLFAAAAAVIITWMIIGRSAPRAIESSVIPAPIIARASRIHDDCSRVAEVSEKLHAADFPADRGTLAAAVERDLHTAHPWPDLSALGFHYIGAGPCGTTLPDAIHLLYHTDRPHTQATISVFVQPFTKQYALELNHVYTVSVPQSPFPMLVWRSADVVYFLLADDATTESAALNLIHQ